MIGVLPFPHSQRTPVKRVKRQTQKQRDQIDHPVVPGTNLHRLLVLVARQVATRYSFDSKPISKSVPRDQVEK